MTETDLAQFTSQTRQALETRLADATAQIRALPEGLQKGRMRQQAWGLQQMLAPASGYFSQAGQDHFLEEHVFRGKRGGVFVEVGAYDGVSGSNGLFFELLRGWTGLLIEADPALCAKVRASRSQPCLQTAIAAEAGEVSFLSVSAGYTQMGGIVDSLGAREKAAIEADPRSRTETITVPARRLADVLREQGLYKIDYLSLDIEGAELGVLEGFPFSEFRITAWTIEANNHAQRIVDLMLAKGYAFLGVVGVDLVFALKT
ncbi:FkbM family methyltransferase [Pseudoruegeria sp. SHC-113]|uniref:FkbM family methyltransferase n=1 Tax=Pseudoruegeria sp. SHC-113 TaxID=2855439 RepID=UPI0021BB56BB|nr:FkbM family methyltransferase [Pseudoruegeria sp. SHC-113]MCT8158848.1 FkbM family methyltransferase [Pseudoruegeria sp. SHC-113]